MTLFGIPQPGICQDYPVNIVCVAITRIQSTGSCVLDGQRRIKKHMTSVMSQDIKHSSPTIAFPLEMGMVRFEREAFHGSRVTCSRKSSASFGGTCELAEVEQGRCHVR